MNACKSMAAACWSAGLATLLLAGCAGLRSPFAGLGSSGEDLAVQTEPAPAMSFWGKRRGRGTAEVSDPNPSETEAVSAHARAAETESVSGSNVQNELGEKGSNRQHRLVRLPDHTSRSLVDAVADASSSSDRSMGTLPPALYRLQRGGEDVAARPAAGPVHQHPQPPPYSAVAWDPSVPPATQFGTDLPTTRAPRGTNAPRPSFAEGLNAGGSEAPPQWIEPVVERRIGRAERNPPSSPTTTQSATQSMNRMTPGPAPFVPPPAPIASTQEPSFPAFPPVTPGSSGPGDPASGMPAGAPRTVTGMPVSGAEPGSPSGRAARSTDPEPLRVGGMDLAVRKTEAAPNVRHAEPPALPNHQVAPPIDGPKTSASNDAQLKIDGLAFCTQIRGFGDIDPLPPEKLRAGQQILLYAEVAHFSSRAAGGMFETALASRIALERPDGTLVVPFEFEPLLDRSKSSRTDFFCHYAFVLPKTLATGSYVLRLVLQDLHDGKRGERTMNFVVHSRDSEER